MCPAYPSKSLTQRCHRFNCHDIQIVLILVLCNFLQPVLPSFVSAVLRRTGQDHRGPQAHHDSGFWRSKFSGQQLVLHTMPLKSIRFSNIQKNSGMILFHPHVFLEKRGMIPSEFLKKD